MRYALAAATALAYAVLLLSPLAVILYSVSPGAALEIPPSGASLRWYAGLADQPRLVSGLATSLILGAVATGAALLAGIPAALALTRGSVPGREAILAVLLSPLSLPGLVLGLGVLTSAAVLAEATGVQLAGTLLPLVAAHLLITIPWVVRSVVASLESADPALEDQARSLGAGPFATLFLVTLPNARAGIVAGAVSAFVISFGNFALSLLLASGRTVTLPVAIYETVDRYQDPTVAAISTLTIGAAVAAAVFTDRISETAKTAGRSARGAAGARSGRNGFRDAP